MWRLCGTISLMPAAMTRLLRDLKEFMESVDPALDINLDLPKGVVNLNLVTYANT